MANKEKDTFDKLRRHCPEEAIRAFHAYSASFGFLENDDKRSIAFIKQYGYDTYPELLQAYRKHIGRKM